jgi:hypothetical protein
LLRLYINVSMALHSLYLFMSMESAQFIYLNVYCTVYANYYVCGISWFYIFIFICKLLNLFITMSMGCAHHICLWKFICLWNLLSLYIILSMGVSQPMYNTMSVEFANSLYSYIYGICSIYILLCLWALHTGSILGCLLMSLPKTKCS